MCMYVYMYTASQDTVHCYLCEKDVDASAKHCRYCDKCVKGFDHHWYINTYVCLYVCMYVCMYTQCSKSLLCCDALQQVVEHLYRQRELRLLPGCGVLGVHTHLRGHRPLPRAHGNRYISIIHTYIHTYIDNIVGVCIDVQIISFADSDKLLYSYDQNAYENNPDISLLALQVPYIHTYIYNIIFTKLHAYILTCYTYCLYRVRVLELLQLHLCIHTFLHTYIHTHVHTYISLWLRRFFWWCRCSATCRWLRWSTSWPAST